MLTAPDGGPEFHLDEAFSLIPTRPEELCGDYTTEANRRALQAMLKMGKIDIAAIEDAYAGA